MTRNPLKELFPAEAYARLRDVETLLAAQAESRDERLGAWTAEPVAAGGKRVRPLLLLTAFDACKGGQERLADAIAAAASVELIHTASLVHDDIMDRADTRRGKPSTYAAHGLDGAILVGDYLFTQAFALGARLPRDAVDLMTDACRRLCEGQLREKAFQDTGSRDPATYRAIIRDKTATLLAAACGIGAIVAGAPPERVARLTDYGDALGHAFQVLDDVLDVAGDPQWTGKPAGTDYLAGTMSSPYLAFLERGGTLPGERRSADWPRVRDELFSTGAVAEAQQEAATYTQAALLALDGLPDSASRQALAGLAEHLMERVG